MRGAADILGAKFEGVGIAVQEIGETRHCGLKVQPMTRLSDDWVFCLAAYSIRGPGCNPLHQGVNAKASFGGDGHFKSPTHRGAMLRIGGGEGW